MTSLRRAVALALAAGATLLGSGCAPRPPAIVPAEGTVFLNGKPLPMARVEFIPELKNFGAEYNSTAVTDENGHFVLICAINQQPGAAVATHHVVVTEHVPDDLRGTSGQAQTRQAEYLAKLKNRPIPEQYGVFSKTPLTVEVKPGQTTYELQMSR
jgi:hypothetical protein